MAEKKQAPLNKLLTIYFYHTASLMQAYEEWKNINSRTHLIRTSFTGELRNTLRDAQMQIFLRPS